MVSKKYPPNFFKKLWHWAEWNVWPWKEISVLRRTLGAAQAQLGYYQSGEATHRGKWMAQANRHWGSRPFTDGEEATMVRFYDQGYGCLEALERLRVYCGYTPQLGSVRR